MKSLASAEVLSETRERLLNVSFEHKALWGSMNAAQMARHLAESYEMALGEFVVKPVPRFPRGLIRWGALRSGVRWPKGVQTPPELARAIQASFDEGFGEIVKRTVAKMERVAAGRDLVQSHPMLGQMTQRDWMRWGYLHADHHLRQFGR